MKHLTLNQMEVLEGLWNEPATGVAPMDFGGSNGSHHGATATRMCAWPDPLVERRKRGSKRWSGSPPPTDLMGNAIPEKRLAGRGSYAYRLTPRGVRVIEEMRPGWAARRKSTAVQP